LAATSKGMNILMQTIFVALVSEIIFLLLLVTPWPAGFLGPILRAISSSKTLETAAKPLVWFFALVVANWLHSTREMLRLNGEYTDKKAGDIGQKLMHEVMMFRSQRDFYLAGFTALLLLVLRRIYLLVKEVHTLKASSTALKRQAEQAAAAYTSQLDEIEKLKKGAAASGSSPPATAKGVLSGRLDADEIEARAKAAAAEALTSPKAAAAAAGEGDGESVGELKEENARLRSTIGSLRGEAQQAAASAEALQRQAENLSKEYGKVVAQKESLENRLADFELVMGDSVKKEK